ncbi:MAG: helicase RepA family protein [Bacteroidales bacterium]|jgi:hypothetical protein|nr:helicase RepA family protein [Bacteroidales bacterium]
MRALTVQNVLNTKLRTAEFEGVWKEAFGCPELKGTWIVYGETKNGKTDFTMKLAKYLTRFGKVLYNAVEEGRSISFQEAIKRNNLIEVNRKMLICDNEPIEELIERLKKQRSPKIIIIDTLQFWGLQYKEYLFMRSAFKNKLFIYVSHVEGKHPKGNIAKDIMKLSNVICRVEGFRMFPVSRYGGGQHMDLNDELTKKNWL